MGLALKCDETEAGRSENTLQNIKNYKSLANVKKNISLHKQFLHTFGDSIDYIDPTGKKWRWFENGTMIEK